MNYTYLGYLLLMIFIVSSYAVKSKHNWFAILSFSLLLGIRECGLDYPAYRSLFLYLYNSPYALFNPNYYQLDLGSVNFEWLYLILIKILKVFSMPTFVFFMLIAFLQIFFCDLFIQRFKDYRQKMLLAYFFFTSLLFVECFNTMRQMVAFFMLINLLPYLASCNFKKYIGGNLLLYLVHSSTFVLLPIYFFMRKNIFANEKRLIGIYVLCVVLAKVLVQYLQEFSYFLYTLLASLGLRAFSYMDTSNDALNEQNITSNTNIGTIGYYLILLIFIVFNGEQFKRKYDKLGIVLFNMTYIGFIVQNFVFNVGIQRFNYYFFYMSFIVLALISYENLVRNKVPFSMKLYTLAVLMLSLAWFTNSILAGAAGCAPYQLCVDFK